MNTCKQCNKGWDNDEAVVTYKKSKWRGAGGYQGSYEYDQEYTADAGIFCSDECLVAYLKLTEE